MVWLITWDDLSPEDKAAKLYLRKERTQKSQEPRRCCFFPKCRKPIGYLDLYKQHAGHADRIGHVECVEKFYKGGAIPIKPTPSKRKNMKIYTSEDLQKAVTAAYAEGFKAGSLQSFSDVMPNSAAVPAKRSKVRSR